MHDQRSQSEIQYLVVFCCDYVNLWPGSILASLASPRVAPNNTGKTLQNALGRFYLHVIIVVAWGVAPQITNPDAHKSMGCAVGYRTGNPMDIAVDS